MGGSFEPRTRYNLTAIGPTRDSSGRRVRSATKTDANGGVTRVRRKTFEILGLSIAAALLCPLPLMAQTPAAIKVGVVNQDRVLNESEEGKRLKADLEKLRTSKAATIDA